MDLFDLIQGQLFNQSTMNELSNEAHAEPEKVENFTKLAIPTMLEALRRNASNEEGKQSLDRALNDHEEDPSHDLLDFFKRTDETDGDKILNHMFGQNKQQVGEKLAATSGLDLGSVFKLLVRYAPMILSMLALSRAGKEQQTTPQPAPRTQHETSGSGLDLTDVIGDLTGRSQKRAQDASGGNLLDSLGDIFGGFLK